MPRSEKPKGVLVAKLRTPPPVPAITPATVPPPTNKLRFVDSKWENYVLIGVYDLESFARFLRDQARIAGTKTITSQARHDAYSVAADIAEALLRGESV